MAMRGAPFHTFLRTCPDYWTRKFEANHARDIRNLEKLSAAGWEALVIWECEIGDKNALAKRLAAFLGPRSVGVQQSLARTPQMLHDPPGVVEGELDAGRACVFEFGCQDTD